MAPYALEREGHDLRAEPNVVDLPEIVAPQAPLPVEKQHRGRALQLVGAEGPRQLFHVRLVDGDRKRQALFLDQRLDGARGLLVLVFERRMQPNDRDLVVVEAANSRSASGRECSARPGTEPGTRSG